MHVAPAPRILAPTILAAIVQTVAADRAQWSHLVAFRHEQRYWVRLDAPQPFSDSVDIWLLTWLPQQQTEPHDHGGSAAAFQVLQGTLTEVRWQSDGSSSSLELHTGHSREVPAEAIHDVVNRGSEPAISIHAYSPRLTFMKYYEATESGLRAVHIVETDNPEGEWVR